MIICDLNYLEVAQEEVLGGFTVPKGGGNEYGNIVFYENVNINKYIQSKVNLKGSTATVQSTADAVGNGTLTQVFTATLTTPYSSSSSGTSISASS